MKRFVLSAAALTALVTTSVAVATLRSVDVAPVSATLSATTPSNVHTRTHTCDGQTFEITTGRWSGTSTSTTPDLNGPVELHLKSFYNVTKKLGWIEGRMKIGASDGRTRAWVSGVNSDGKLDAWVRGSAGRGDGMLFGSLAGTFSKTGGLTGGAIGTGANTNAALLVKGLRCRSEQTPRPSVHLLVRGQIGALSASSISVKPRDGSAAQTCAVSDADDVERVKVGDEVEMICTQASGGWVLTKVRKR